MKILSNLFLRNALPLLFLLMIPSSVFAQSEGGRVGFGFSGGGVKYWGTFTDNQLWFGGDLFVRWNIINQISFQAGAGWAQLRYKNSAEQVAKYPEFYNRFGIGDFAKQSEKSFSRISTYEAFLSWNILPKEKFVPYVFGGVGITDWNPTYDNGKALPLNDGTTYEKRKMMFPVGVGFELYLTDDLVFNGRGTVRITGTPWLDGYDPTKDNKPADGDDIFMTFGAGFTYYVFGNADYDNDGVTNSREREIGTDINNPDTDGDGLKDGEEVFTYYTDPLKADTDGDNLTDYDEIFKHKTQPTRADTDSDGLNDGEELIRKTSPINPDSDGDGLLDGEEIAKYKTDPAKADTDGDGLKDGEEAKRYNTNPILLDSDNDGIDDGEEVNTTKTNPALADSDNDGLRDGDELKQYKTDPMKADTDGDGLNDGEEMSTYKTDPLKTDTDADGLADGDEIKRYSTNPIATDSDNDGLNDGDEVNTYKSNPALADSDSDGLRDGDEIKQYKTDVLKSDSDADGISDGDEVKQYSTNPAKPDSDGDGLNDGDELRKYKSNPLSEDSDQDGLKDGEEVLTYKTDLLKNDSDGDGLKDGEEVATYKTDPAKPDTDGDGLKDGEEVNQYKTDPLKTDTDGDTIADGEEVNRKSKKDGVSAEPTNPAKADTDDDGVRDDADYCALIAGKPSTDPKQNGCPEPPKIGTKTDFPEILFKVGTNGFNFDEPATAGALAKLLAYVQQCDNLQVMIEGHTSSEGSAKVNQPLSQKRAEAVRDWLIAQGVKPTKIAGAIGYAATRPTVKEPTGKDLKKMTKKQIEEIRSKNRRITVAVQKGCD